MSALWLIVGLIAVLVSALLLRALRVDRPAGRAEYDLQIYRDQLREVARDQERGLLSEEQAAAATAEIERRILAAADSGEASPGTSAPLGRPVTIGVAMAVPLAAFALYLNIGSPSIPDVPFAGRAVPEPNTQVAGQGAEMTAMIDRLAQRLAESPEDAQGWQLLARSYLTVENYQAAMDAFEKAIQYGGREPEMLSGYVEARVMAAGGRVDDQTLEIADEVLAQQPTNLAALFYTGMGRAQKNDVRGAIQAWVDLAAVAPPDAPWLPDVRGRIDSAAAELGVAADSVKPSEAVQTALAAMPPPASPAAPGAPGPTREDMEAAAQMAPAERMAMIRGMVDGLAARLESDPNDLEGWVRLERAYRVLGETEKADEAARRVAALRESAPPAAETPQRGPTQEDMEAASDMSPEERQAMIRSMVQGLADRLKENPNDLRGWVMLERSYRVLGETEKADEVAERIEAMRGATR